MEFEGIVFRILPATKGTSARGDWERQDVVFEIMDGAYSRKICVTFFNRQADTAKLREGATFQVSVNIESREYNGKWYTDVRAWRLLPKEQAAPEAAPMSEMAPFGEEPQYVNSAANTIDDLPF